jgi:hypothetical protein
VEHVAHMREMRNVYKILVRKPEEKGREGTSLEIYTWMHICC